MTRRFAFFLAAAMVLASCGGDDDDESPTSTNPPPASSAPGGLYVGYYQEDPATNPEDPVPGAFVLNLPEGDNTFTGSMYFTYVGCQTSNVGVLSGTKKDLALSGDWSGTVDGLAEAGTYAGTFDPLTAAYSGTYLNSGGKQFRDLRPCIEYTIAPNGTWAMYPIERSTPAGFAVSVTGRTIAWSSTSGAAITLLYVLDPVVAQGSGNPVVFQTVVGGAGTNTQIPGTVALQSGKEYVAVVGLANASSQSLAFGSRRFTQP